MCLSRPTRVVRLEGPSSAEVEGAGGRRTRISLLALEGPPPRPGEWLIVHAGYAVDRIDAEEARRTIADLRVVEARPLEPGT